MNENLLTIGVRAFIDINPGPIPVLSPRRNVPLLIEFEALYFRIATNRGRENGVTKQYTLSQFPRKISFASGGKL